MLRPHDAATGGYSLWQRISTLLCNKIIGAVLVGLVWAMKLVVDYYMLTLILPFGNFHSIIYLIYVFVAAVTAWCLYAVNTTSPGRMSDNLNWKPSQSYRSDDVLAALPALPSCSWQGGLPSFSAASKKADDLSADTPATIFIADVALSNGHSGVNAGEPRPRNKVYSTVSVPTYNAQTANCYCDVCDMTVAPHTYHCLVCRECISGYDHHCMILNNCIGKQNRREFVQLVGWVVLGCALGIGLIISSNMLQIITERPSHLSHSSLPASSFLDATANSTRQLAVAAELLRTSLDGPAKSITVYVRPPLFEICIIICCLGAFLGSGLSAGWFFAGHMLMISKGYTTVTYPGFFEAAPYKFDDTAKWHFLFVFGPSVWTWLFPIKFNRAQPK